METLEKIGKGALVTGLVGVVGGAITLFAGVVGDFWGSRGVNDLYKFQYQEKPAIVQYDNRILAPDKYWIALKGGDKIVDGKLTSDDGKEVCIGLSNPSFGHYLVRDKQE